MSVHLIYNQIRACWNLFNLDQEWVLQWTTQTQFAFTVCKLYAQNEGKLYLQPRFKQKNVYKTLSLSTNF